MAQQTKNYYSQNTVTRGEESAMMNLAIKVSSAVERLAMKKTNDLLSMLGQVPIQNFCDNASRNEAVRLGLMQLNIYEHDVTLRTIGSDVADGGDSRSITNMALNPSYTAPINYSQNFARDVVKDEIVGDHTTRRKSSTNDHNFDDHHINQVYDKTERLYYDDNDTGSGNFTDANKMNLFDANSILSKTKRLFIEKKMNTIISRFHTEKAPESMGESRTKYGMSHGRNLLTKDAELNGGQYEVNGYNNPYCRVWTHHYQYDKLMKRIRPFYQIDDKGYVKPTSLKDLHTWDNFMTDDGKGWKDGNVGWELSALGDNGFPIIAPKFGGGGKSNIHTKQCMFSIENLAWKGFNPYEFEKALSWEQRGPNGGRIMWFPPYGISFTENTSANWNEHVFIGRGEGVYTYSNTQRSGTLSFMLIVDHPSIIDYISHDDKGNTKATDTDLLRFFAGCDDGSSVPASGGNESTSMRDVATPTPLTDEYIEVDNSERIKPERIEPPKPEPEPEIEPEPPLVYNFYVFYPNNYSGVYDRKDSQYYDGVEAMAYLLAGRGAQMDYNSTNPVNSKSIGLTFDELDESDWTGYEMNSSSVSSGASSKNVIVGSATTWAVASQNKQSKWKASNRTWKYRIDGFFTENGQVDKAERNKNCYDQKLLKESNYSDNQSFQLNGNAKQVEDAFKEEGVPENLISFADMAYLIAPNGDVRDKIEENASISNEKDGEELTAFGNLKKLLNVQTDGGNEDNSEPREIESIKIVGYSNSHGNNANSSTNDDRNNQLAKNRAESVKNWLVNYLKVDSSKVNISTESVSSKEVNNTDKTNASGLSAKKWRSALVTIEFKTGATTTLSQSNPTAIEGVDNTSEFVGWSKHVDSDGSVYYMDESGDGRKWVYDEKTDELVYKADSTIFDRSFEMGSSLKKKRNEVESEDGNDEYNRVRYDQEYHFFKVLSEKDPMVFGNLMKKIQYFDPAFHSMTPEGFNARLTFLSQCMRQGNTLTISDQNGKNVGTMANNLAFGRAPYCVLRLGDFYNQMIVIDNISISYDPLQWDLNPEGIGLQPLLANVNISFKFIGGGDLGGPVRRLQNAMSFNYYANARLYDNRADKMKYNWDWRTNGALDHELDADGSEFNEIAMKS